jgi:chromosome segregation ATPase
MKSPELLKVTPSSEAEAIYEAYPRKASKMFALKAIQKAIKRHGSEHLLKRTREYAAAFEASGRSLQFLPYPATFFNQEQFNDDFAAFFPPTTSGKPQAQEPVWMRIKAVQGLIDTNKKRLDRLVQPNPLRYAVPNGARFQKDMDAYNHQRTELIAERKALHENLEALNRQLV